MEYSTTNVHMIMAALHGGCETHSAYSVTPDKLNCSMNFTSLSLFISSDHLIKIKNPIINLSGVSSKNQAQLAGHIRRFDKV